MLTEAKTYNESSATSSVPMAQRAVSRPLSNYVSRSAQFLAIVAQFALLAIIVDYWQLESQLLTRLWGLAFVGFIIHHLVLTEFELEREMRDSVGSTLYFGTSEIQRNIIARGLRL